MKTLLVDNGTTLLQRLERLIPGNEVVVTWDDLPADIKGVYDLVVLSGSSDKSVVGNEEAFTREIELIQTAKVPIVGICLGSELIIESFGGILERMDHRHKGIVEITSGDKNFSVYENHLWRVKQLPLGFEVLAASPHGIELYRHREHPIVGFQFHPEHFVDTTQGDEIFRDILKGLVY